MHQLKDNASHRKKRITWYTSWHQTVARRKRGRVDEQTLADVPLSPHWVTSDRGPAMNTLTGRTSPPWLTVSIGVTRTDRSATVINKRTSSTCCPIVLPQAQLLFFVTAVKQLLQSMRRFRPCFVYMSMLGWLTDFVGPSQLVDFFF